MDSNASFCFIDEHQDKVKKPIQSDGKLNEFQLDASRNIFVGNLPWEYSKDKIHEMFSPFGTILNIYEVGHHCFCYIEYTNAVSCVKAIQSMDRECYDKNIPSKTLSVHFGRQTMASNCLWIDHVAKSATEEEVRHICGRRDGKFLSIKCEIK